MRVLDEISRQGRQLGEKGVLFPATDAYVLFVSRFRDELSDHFVFALPPRETVESLLDKRRQYKLAERTGMPIPRTYYPRSSDDVQRMKHKIEYPVFIKPCYSHIYYEKFRNKGMEVDTPAELPGRYERVMEANAGAVVQSVVRGPDSNVFELYVYFSREGRAIATFVTRKLRQYPNNFGIGTCLVSVHHSEMRALGLEFLRAIGYRGLVSIEFKIDSWDGKCRFLELNARLPSHNQQAAAAGINFPLIQYLDLTSGLADNVTNYKDGVVWWDPSTDFLAFREHNQKGELSTADWVRSILKTDCQAFLSADDPAPFAQEIVNDLRRLRYVVTGYRNLSS
jgi:predicted ATP-grasp superfamily ATP-dependent carboligase